MNKKDIDKLCTIIVEWEFREGGSSSEAAARANCAARLREEFGITDDHLSVYRALEICRRTDDDSDELFDFVCDMVDDDYQGLLDAIDAAGDFQGVLSLYQAHKASTPKP
jgi:hypothetical protein